MKMPDASGFGDYQESGTGIHATYKGEPCNFSVQMYLDDEPPITGGRESWGFPKKYGIPRLNVIGNPRKPSGARHQTIVSTLAGNSMVQRSPSPANTRSTRPPNSYVRRSRITLLP